MKKEEKVIDLEDEIKIEKIVEGEEKKKSKKSKRYLFRFSRIFFPRAALSYIGIHA